MDSAFNELSEIFNIHFFKTDFLKQSYYYEGGQVFLLLGPMHFAEYKMYHVSIQLLRKSNYTMILYNLHVHVLMLPSF